MTVNPKQPALIQRFTVCWTMTEQCCWIKVINYQVQLQLYVTASDWCDFFIFTTKGVMVERILPDSTWIEFRIPQLETYFDEEIPPEVVWPCYKQEPITSSYKPSYGLAACIQVVFTVSADLIRKLLCKPTKGDSPLLCWLTWLPESE